MSARLVVSRLALVVALLVWATPAVGATVAIVRPANPAPVMTETLVRIAGELTSVGFATEQVEAPPVTERTSEREWRTWLEQLAAQRHVDAVVALVGASTPDAVEVWIIDRVTGKSMVRRVPFEPLSARAPETLSIRAIELLRSSFLEIGFAARAAHGEPKEPAAAIARLVNRDRAASPSGRVALDVGAAGLVSTDGVGPLVLPLVRLQWAARPSLLLHATVAGLGTRATVSTTAGSAQVAQGYGLLGVAWRLREREQLRPFLSLAAGALHTSVDGRPESPNRGRAADQWSFLAEVGAGAALRLRNRFELSLATYAHLAEPYLAVRFVDAVVATSGRPNLLVSLTMGAGL